MSYFSLFDYTKWYNWYYGIAEETPVVLERIETPTPQPQVPLAEVSIGELETQQEAVPVVSKKSTLKNYHLRK